MFAPRLSDFPKELQRGCSKKLAALAAQWPKALDDAPRSLAYLTRELRSRKCLLERVTLDGRVYWAARFPKEGEPLAKGPMIGAEDTLGAWTAEDGSDDGFDARRAAAKFIPSEEACRALPELRWLATTFGSLTLEAEQSGNGVFGKRLRDIHAGSGIWDLVRAEQPPGYEHWLSLYEVDGDWLMFDPPTRSVRWVGGEWGEAAGRAKWTPKAALKHVLETLLRGGQTNAYEMKKKRKR